MRFFFDNNLSPRLSKALDALEGEQGHSVIHLRQKFDKVIPDEEWLSTLGDEGNWIVLTSDYRITKNPHEVAAWKEAGLTVFFFRTSWFKIQFWEQAAVLIRRWPKIVSLSERNPTDRRYIVPTQGAKFTEL